MPLVATVSQVIFGPGLPRPVCLGIVIVFVGLLCVGVTCDEKGMGSKCALAQRRLGSNMLHVPIIEGPGAGEGI